MVVDVDVVVVVSPEGKTMVALAEDGALQGTAGSTHAIDAQMKYEEEFNNWQLIIRSLYSYPDCGMFCSVHGTLDRLGKSRR